MNLKRLGLILLLGCCVSLAEAKQGSTQEEAFPRSTIPPLAWPLLPEVTDDKCPTVNIFHQRRPMPIERGLLESFVRQFTVQAGSIQERIVSDSLHGTEVTLNFLEQRGLAYTVALEGCFAEMKLDREYPDNLAEQLDAFIDAIYKHDDVLVSRLSHNKLVMLLPDEFVVERAVQFVNAMPKSEMVVLEDLPLGEMYILRIREMWKLVRWILNAIISENSITPRVNKLDRQLDYLIPALRELAENNDLRRILLSTRDFYHSIAPSLGQEPPEQVSLLALQAPCRIKSLVGRDRLIDHITKLIHERYPNTIPRFIKMVRNQNLAELLDVDISEIDSRVRAIVEEMGKAIEEDQEAQMFFRKEYIGEKASLEALSHFIAKHERSMSIPATAVEQLIKKRNYALYLVKQATLFYGPQPLFYRPPGEETLPIDELKNNIDVLAPPEKWPQLVLSNRLFLHVIHDMYLCLRVSYETIKPRPKLDFPTNIDFSKYTPYAAVAPKGPLQIQGKKVLGKFKTIHSNKREMSDEPDIMKKIAEELKTAKDRLNKTGFGLY